MRWKRNRGFLRGVWRSCAWRSRATLLSWATLLVLAAAPSGAAPSRRLVALATDAEITLDGRFDEPVWARAEVASGFVQREPEPGAAATERTEVRVVYTPRTLYVGIYAYDSDPEAIIAREMQRDGTLFRDDSIALLLDTFDDDRNAYMFEFAPLGARTDALVTDEGRDTNFDWDGVWSCATRRNGDGWSAEAAIPFSTLRFDPTAAAWGFNVRRLVRRKNEFLFWAPIPLEAGLFRVSLYGELAGIRGVDQGANLNVKPFLATSSADATEASDLASGDETEAGLDVKWGITRGLALDLTVNTDFAETEVDEQRVNLTRFSLFFPEKREFFLENAGIFEFGAGQDLKVFFSRRIGIDEGDEVPIDWGVRLTGRVGGWNLGVLDVATAALDREFDDDGDGGPAERNNWGALRLKRNLGQRSSVGLIATNREGEDDSNRVVGADFDWKPNDNLAVNGFFARSDDSVVGSDEAAGLVAEWDGAEFDWQIGLLEIGEGFEAQMGFLRRPGTRQAEVELDWEPRPEHIQLVRNFSFEGQAEVVTTLDGTVETSEIDLEPFGLRFDSEDRMAVFVRRSFERLFEPFEIVDGVEIPIDEYTFVDYGVRLGTSDARTVQVRGRFSLGDFFDGTRRSVSATVGVRPSQRLRSETTVNWEDVELSAGAFTATVVRERVGFSFSPEMRLDAFVQYNDLDEEFGMNVRYNWIYKPGADLFVVFNQGWDAPSLGDLTRRDRQVIVKFTYLYQR